MKPKYSLFWLSALVYVLSVFGILGSAVAATYEETIAALRLIAELPARSPDREEKITAIVNQWDGRSTLDPLRSLLADFSTERHRHQAQAWMFRIHAAEAATKGDLVADLAMKAPTDDQRRRLLLLADPRYMEGSERLRSLMVRNLDDSGVVLELETNTRWPIRNRLQSMLFHYGRGHGLFDEVNFPDLGPYMGPEFEDDAITRTKAVIAAHPELFPLVPKASRLQLDHQIKTTPNSASGSPNLTTQNDPHSQSSRLPASKPTVPTPSEEPASSMPWSVIVVLIVAACGLLWLLLKKRK